MQSQLDAQNKAIADTRNELASTQGDLNNTRTELTGSIAHTHDELVTLEKRGQKNYTEFDINKSKEFAREGPFSVKLRKANEKHQFADLDLIVDDRTLTQKHVNLYQPVMFSTPDSPQPVEVVINQIGKNHIHGYIAAPRYRQSELASVRASATRRRAGSGWRHGTGGRTDVADQTAAVTNGFGIRWACQIRIDPHLGARKAQQRTWATRHPVECESSGASCPWPARAR